ncbi:phosphate starvation-inducible protein PsiF [Methylocystis heyeri]|uniref:Phosphate starvation-inducible protein PsiF n=2 Tax=Methylocystis heyeri TaxID=391905 RepID=A0A6B8KLY1_9HYPH|nr:phosphate starvation-inducible protein PsiF [Methylocystis heyeri]
MYASPAMAEQVWAPPAEIAGKVPQAQAQAETAPAPAAQKPATAEDAKTKRKDCRAQADAKGLHGKARKAFRAECEKA